MSRLRNLALLLAVCLIAIALAWFGLDGDGLDYPTGSTRSYAPDGGRALFLWTEALGRPAQRLEHLTFEGGTAPDTLLLVQPSVAVPAEARRTLDQVLAGGGTLILAGDSPALRAYGETLGIDVETTQRHRRAEATGQGGAVLVDTSLRLHDAGATPLLVAPNGDVVALRKPYLNGAVVVVAGAAPFTNDGLRDPDTARFVYHLLFDATGPDQTVAFDESHDALAVVDGQPVAGFGELVRQTAPGRALLYAVLLTFTYLLLSGRRLGPPLTPADPSQTGRTMFEQVQALAGLYRRAGQLDYLRRHFAEHYRRAVARSAGLEPGDGAEQDGLAIRLRARGLAGDHAARLEDAHSQLSRARTEAQLLSAVARMDETLQALPSGRSGR